MPKTKLHKSVDISQWVSISRAAEILGHKFSEPSIRRRIQSGQWKENVHWVNISNGNERRSYRINVSAISDVSTWN